MSETPEKRAQFVADLRALADLFELDEALPVPAAVMDATGFPSSLTQDKQDQIAMLFAASERLGTPVTHDRIRGVVETRLTLGCVSYGLYVKVDPRPRPADTVTVFSAAELLGATAVAR